MVTNGIMGVLNLHKSLKTNKKFHIKIFGFHKFNYLCLPKKMERIRVQ